MKLITKIGLSVATISALLLTGCNQPAQEVSDTQLSYRNVDLLADSGTPKVKFVKNNIGSGKKFKRGFQDAPPMIPHDTEGMLPITQNNNQCIGCHVDAASADKSIPSVPVSHMTNFRPKSIAVSGSNTSSAKLANVSIKKLNHLYQGRFNCSQCHAPQSTQEPLVKNTFTPEFTTKDGSSKSNLIDVINEGVQ